MEPLKVALLGCGSVGTEVARFLTTHATELAQRIERGARVALVSDAGMPAISDPGYRLIRRCIERALDVTVLPGPSVVPVALVASGLPTDRWRFEGFLPRRSGEMERVLRSAETVVAFESPRRIGESLAALAAIAPDRPVAVCRELTKMHEEISRGSLAELARRDGLFDVIATRVAILGRGNYALLFALCLAFASLTTALFNLDTTAVLLTPVLLALAARAGIAALPLAMTTVWTANTASLLLPVSNLTNLLAMDRAGLSTHEFAARMWLPAVVAVVLTVALLGLRHHRLLRVSLHGRGVGPAVRHSRAGRRPDRAVATTLALTVPGGA